MLSRHRPLLVRNAVLTALENADDLEALDIRVLFDDDEVSPSVLADLPINCHRALNRHYYVRGANALLRLCETEQFVFTNDDSVFLPGWDTAARDALDKCGGVVELGGKTGKCAHFVTTKSFINEIQDGYLAQPCYTFYFSDRELMYRASAVGKYACREPGVITHTVVKDGVRSDVLHWMNTDRETWVKRMKKYGFRDDTFKDWPSEDPTDG
jgi:hypothetical protein